jgi:cation:H+ antiporter
MAMPLADAVSYPLWLNGALFLAAAVVIWIVGTRLTRALDVLAEKTGLGHVFVGMLLLGGITSLPELANVTTASAGGNPSLAINNLLGSAAINIVLLAVADAVVGRKAVTSVVAQPSTMMMGALGMIVLVTIAAGVTLGDVALGPLGIGSLIIGIMSLVFFWMSSGYDERSSWTVEEEREEEKGEVADPEQARDGRSIPRLWIEVVICGALLFAAGYTLSQVGDALAEQLGLTSAIVGFALIGTATSLPELVTVLVALRLNRPEMAFGQVLGTNFINLALLPLGDLIYDGEPVLNTLGAFEVVSALLGAMLIGFFLVGLLEHRNRTIFRMGIDSAAVLAVFALGATALSQVPAEPQQEGARERKGSAK